MTLPWWSTQRPRSWKVAPSFSSKAPQRKGCVFKIRKWLFSLSCRILDQKRGEIWETFVSEAGWTGTGHMLWRHVFLKYCLFFLHILWKLWTCALSRRQTKPFFPMEMSFLLFGSFLSTSGTFKGSLLLFPSSPLSTTVFNGEAPSSFFKVKVGDKVKCIFKARWRTAEIRRPVQSK